MTMPHEVMAQRETDAEIVEVYDNSVVEILEAGEIEVVEVAFAGIIVVVPELPDAGISPEDLLASLPASQ